MRIQEVRLICFAYGLLMRRPSKKVAKLVFKTSYFFFTHIWSIIMSVIRLYQAGSMIGIKIVIIMIRPLVHRSCSCWVEITHYGWLILLPEADRKEFVERDDARFGTAFLPSEEARRGSLLYSFGMSEFDDQWKEHRDFAHISFRVRGFRLKRKLNKTQQEVVRSPNIEYFETSRLSKRSWEELN